MVLPCNSYVEDRVKTAKCAARPEIGLKGFALRGKGAEPTIRA